MITARVCTYDDRSRYNECEKGVLPNVMFGNRIGAQMAFDRFCNGLTAGCTVRRLGVPRSATFSYPDALAKSLEPAVARLLEEYRADPHKHADETPCGRPVTRHRRAVVSEAVIDGPPLHHRHRRADRLNARRQKLTAYLLRYLSVDAVLFKRLVLTLKMCDLIEDEALPSRK